MRNSLQLHVTNRKHYQIEMFRKISEEVEVKATISEVWEVDSTFKHAMIIQLELAHLFTIDILEGDGGVGSVFKVTPNPGKPSFSTISIHVKRFYLKK